MKEKKFRNLKIFYREGTSDEEVVSQGFNHDIFFIPEYLYNQDDIIIDIGAHIGTFSLLAADRLKQGKIHAIEACRESFEYLKKNVKSNNFSNIHCYHLALTNFQGITKLYYNIKDGNWGHSITRNFLGDSEKVPANTLSHFMQKNNIFHCDYLRLNCEGAEFQIILNTPCETLHKIKLILILYHKDLIDGYSEKDLINHLRKCGFSTRLWNKTKRRGWLIARNKGIPLRVFNFMRIWRRLIKWDLWLIKEKLKNTCLSFTNTFK